MLELKDIIDGVVGVLTIMTGWLVRSMYSRPTHDEVRRMIQDNQAINNEAMNGIKEDIKDMKQTNKEISSQLAELKDMIYKALYGNKN